jgi:hypothetical protein
MFICLPTQREITGILVSFRFHRVAVIGDIEQMYPNKMLDPFPKPLHGILWQEKPTQPLKSYEMNVLTFGTASASFLATSVLKHIATHDPINKETEEVLTQDFHMDDCLSERQDNNSAKKLSINIREA